MDDARFDALTRVLGALVDRRTTVRTVAGGVGLLGLAAQHAAGAKNKKKKCKKGKKKCGKTCCKKGLVCRNKKCVAPPHAAECDITMTSTVWTLQADCTITKTIEIPDGVTLDGNGKTIKLAGSFGGFTNASAIAATDGNANVRNLAIDGAQLSDACTSAGGVTGIGFSNVAGEIRDVSVANISCGSGIAVGAPRTGPRKSVAIIDTTVVDADPGGDLGGGGAITVNGGVDVTITGGTVRNAGGFDCAIGVANEATTTIEGMHIENSHRGLDVVDGGQVFARNNTLTNVSIGFVALGTGVTLEATGNTLVGPGATSQESVGIIQDSAGIIFAGGGCGEVDGNTISNFFDADAGDVGCGIFVAEDAGAVTIGTNTFPAPPGNEQDVCDNRP